MVFACHFWNLLSKQSLKATLRFGTLRRPRSARTRRTVRGRLQLAVTEGPTELDGSNEAVGEPETTSRWPKTKQRWDRSSTKRPSAERTGMSRQACICCRRRTPADALYNGGRAYRNPTPMLFGLAGKGRIESDSLLLDEPTDHPALLSVFRCSTIDIVMRFIPSTPPSLPPGHSLKLLFMTNIDNTWLKLNTISEHRQVRSGRFRTLSFWSVHGGQLENIQQPVTMTSFRRRT